MYLKALELQGFKSFADRIRMELGPGITAIVGPNGSGKSNLVDAVRWVLGEQNPRSLRGSRMEDVIFSGTEKKRALSMAEVTLHLDNSSGYLPVDYQDVVVSRRVLRDGTSTYTINRASCRLKDVLEMFWDTGIGREGYSIIGQGRVEEILSQKPEERRALIEEAAGITKYRKRKLEASRKMEHTARDMERVSDLIAEFESELPELSAQAELTERYLSLERRIRLLETWSLWRQAHALRESLAGLADTISRLRESLIAKDQKIQEVSGTLELAEQSVDAQEAALRVLKDKLSGASARLGRLSDLEDSLSERAGSLRDEIAGVSQELGQLDADLESAGNRLKEEEKSCAAISVLEHAIAREVNALDEEHEKMQAKAKDTAAMLDEAKAELLDLLNEQAAVKNALSSTISEGEGKLRESMRIADRIDEGQRVLQMLSSEIDRDTQELLAHQAEAQTVSARLEAQRAEVDRLRAEGAEKQKQLYERQRHYEAAAARLTVLQEMEDRLEGFAQGPRGLLVAAARDPELRNGVLGPLVRLLNVRPPLEQAIEAALGYQAQNVVVRTQEDARAAIELMKRHKMGRATFLPLDLIKPGTLSHRERAALGMQGVIGVAVDLVKYEPEVELAARFALGRVIVCQNIEAALRVARACDLSVKVVTLDGDVVWPGGSMTGGSTARIQAGFISRANEIRELRARIKRLGEEIQQISDERETYMRAEAQASAGVSSLESRLAELGRRISALSANLNATGAERDRRRQEVEDLRAEIARINEAETQRPGRLRELEQKKEQLQAEESRLRETVRTLTEALAESESRREQVAALLTEKKVALATATERRRSLEEHLEKTRRAMEAWAAQASRKRELLKRSQERLAELYERAEACRREKADTAVLVDTLRAEAEEAEAALKRAVAERESARRSHDALARQRQRAVDEIHRLEIEEATLRAQLVAISPRLSQSDTQELSCIEVQTEEEAQEEIARLRSQAEALGPVNLGAPAELNRRTERLRFLRAQYADLHEAAADLQRIIREMDGQIKKLFQRGFDEVNSHFTRIFRLLFEGGNAELVLTDPGDPLNSGVDVRAQPAGRKLQELSLLSGGERALTAIALLFSLLEVRPSPFVILDEIEAALDEANIERFTRLLRHYAQKTQFLVVTHQRGTMSAADVLYGITLEAGGTSRIVSVRLSEQAV
ncbi:MAG: chromosome segregation protein SMC [Bacillota bacterium]